MHAAVSFDDRPPTPIVARLTQLARRLAPLVNLAGSAVAIGWLLALLFQHLQLVLQPAPHEFNESGEWYTTFLLAHGRNPYVADEISGSAVFFGPLYHWVVAACEPLFGLGYPAHRMVNLLCLAGALWLLVTRMLRLGTSLGIALGSAALFYYVALQNIMICARPDTLGHLLFLLAIIVPWEKHYTRGSVLFAAACTLLAFHCKAYLVLPLGPLVLGVWLARGWREAALWTVGFITVLAASLFALQWHFPLYFIETFVMQKNSVWANSQDPAVNLMHLGQLVQRTWPYFVLLALAAFPFFARLRRATAADVAGSPAPTWLAVWRERFSPRDRALLLLLALFLGCLILVNGYMGINGGASFTYHLHLIFPPLFLLAAAASAGPIARVIFGGVLIAFLMPTLSIREVPDSTPGYTRLKDIIEAHDPVLDSTSVAIELLAQRNRPIHNNGYSLCLPFVTMWDRFLWDPQAQLIRESYDRVWQDAEDNLARRFYKIVLTTDDRCYFGRIETLHANYDLVERVELPMYFGASPVEVWQPKTTPPEPAPPPPSS